MNHVQNDNLNTYFGFLAEPFSKDIPAKALYLTEQLKSLFARLRQLLGRRGLALITGEVGCGKSTALRAFADTLDKTQTDWVYIDDPTLGTKGLFNAIATQLNLNTQYFKWRLIPGLKAAIEKAFHDHGKTTVITIDEAQLLKPQELEELRLFTNFKIDSYSPLTLILLAQPDFTKLVRLKSLEAFPSEAGVTHPPHRTDPAGSPLLCQTSPPARRSNRPSVHRRPHHRNLPAGQGTAAAHQYLVL